MNTTSFSATIQNGKEAGILFLLSLQAFFMGAFFAVFYIGSHVLFLQSVGIACFPTAMIISGVIGILYFSVFTYFSNRMSFRMFVFINLMIITALNAGIYLYYDRLTILSLYGTSLMLPFALVFPITIAAMVVFRRSVGSLLTPSQNRRLSPIIHGGTIWGIILSSFGLLASLFLWNWDILYTMAVSTALIAVTLLLQMVINPFHKYSGAFRNVAVKSTILRSKIHEFFYTKYTFILVLFILISGIIGFILHYYFVNETQLHYTDSKELARFFSFFLGTMFLFVHFVQRYLVRKILYSYDSPYSLVLIPAFLVLAFIGSLVAELIVGSTATIARTISFGFLVVAVLRIGYETTFRSIELPSLRVLARTLDLRFTASIISRMEGSFRLVALAAAGALLFAVLLIPIRENLILNILLALLAVIWIPIAISLIKSYQKALHGSIRKLKTSKRTIEHELLNIDEKTHSLINSTQLKKVIHTLDLLEKIEPLRHELYLISLLGTSSDDIRKHLLSKIDQFVLLGSLEKLKELNEHHGKNGMSDVSKLIRRFENKLAAGDSENSVRPLVNSSNLSDRLLAAEIIGASSGPNFNEALAVLSRDIEPEVKFAAVKAIARLAHPDHAYILIGYLNTPAYYPYAFNSLIKIGDPALPHLERVFLAPDVDNIMLSRIVRIYGKIGTPMAMDLLLDKLENQNRTIMNQALLALRESKFQASPGNINRILNDIVRLINIMSWNFSAYSTLRKNSRFKLLKKAFEKEILENYHSLYHLLALAYNPTSIGNIKNFLNEGSDIDISFAIELLDQIVHEDIKQVFLPVVENISIKARYKQLQYFFHAGKQSAEDLIPEILTREFNSISLFVKACAIFNMLNMPRQSASQELAACIFHPDKLLRETAAYVTNQLNPDYLEQVYPRIEPYLAEEIKSSIARSANNQAHLLLHRIIFLKECPKLSDIPEDILLEVVKHLEEHHLQADDEFLIKQHDVHYAFMIIFEGKAEITISTNKVVNFVKNDIIYSDLLIENGTCSLKALTNLKFFSLEQELYNALLFDHIGFRNTVLDLIHEY